MGKYIIWHSDVSDSYITTHADIPGEEMDILTDGDSSFEVICIFNAPTPMKAFEFTDEWILSKEEEEPEE